MQLKRKAKLPTVIGLTTKHAVCCNTLMLNLLHKKYRYSLTIVLLAVAFTAWLLGGASGGHMLHVNELELRHI